LLHRADPFCRQAFAALVDNHMLTNAEELELLDGLPFRAEDRWLALLYRAKCKKVPSPKTASSIFTLTTYTASPNLHGL